MNVFSLNYFFSRSFASARVVMDKSSIYRVFLMEYVQTDR